VYRRVEGVEKKKEENMYAPMKKNLAKICKRLKKLKTSYV
jgi:hypothetical protein